MAEILEKRKIRELPPQPDIYETDLFALDSYISDQTGKITYQQLLDKLKVDIWADLEPEPEPEPSPEPEPDPSSVTRGIIDLIYPVGSVYISMNNVNPATLFGGTWEQIKDKFLLCAGDTYTYGSPDGGEPSVKLSPSETGLVAHTHAFTRPTISGTGSATITGGSHSHISPHDGQKFLTSTATNQTSKARVATSSSSSTYVPYCNQSTVDYSAIVATNSETHTHALPAHNHTLTGGSVGAVTGGAKDATAAHNNMPPYTIVTAWKRVADPVPNSSNS